MAAVVAPQQSTVDESIQIIVNKLRPRQKVTIVAQTTRNDVALSSFALYEADGDGTVDLTKQAALSGGLFAGCEPMGLFWSMQLTSAVKIPFKMLNGNDLDSWLYLIRVYEGHHTTLNEAISLKEKPLAERTIERLFLPNGVQRFNVYYGKMRGVLFLPKGDGPFPAIIDIFGGAFGLVAYRGGLFAGRGFACLCVAYASYADLPKETAVMDSEYFNECYEFLTRHPAIDGNAIGIFGSCLGGTIGLALARCQPGIKALVAVSPEAFAAHWSYRLRSHGATKASKENKVIVVPGGKWNMDRVKEVGDCVDTSGGLDELYSVWRDHSLEYGKIKAPLLFFFGSNDKLVKLDKVIPIFNEQFDKENKKNAEIVVYEGAGHIIQPPFLPMFHKYYSPMFKVQILYGGDLIPHVRAQEKMWRTTLEYFRHHLRQPSKELSKL